MNNQKHLSDFCLDPFLYDAKNEIVSLQIVAQKICDVRKRYKNIDWDVVAEHETH